MKLFTLASFLCLTLWSFSQNVGIGTTTPQAKLHVFNATNSNVLTETNGVSQFAGFEAKTNGGLNDDLILRKWMPGSSGTQAGINLANLSQVISGVQAGGLMIGVSNANPLYFITSNLERMRIAADGKVGVNTGTPGAVFEVRGRTDVPITGFFQDLTTTGQRAAVNGYIQSTGSGSVGVAGVTFEGGSVPPLEAGTYGVLGESGAGGFAVAGFSVSSTALRGKSTSGLSLHTSGNIRFDGIGEGAGKVLTSNASGDATWMTLPSSSGVWAADGNNIYNTNSGYVGINDNTPSARLDIRNPTTDTMVLNISYSGGVRKTQINGNRQFYHEGDFWVHSAFGRIRLGYPDKGWYWATTNGGQDLQLFSHSTTDVDASRVNRIYIDGATGNVGINTNNNPAVYGKLIVDRNADLNGALAGYFGVVTGLNSSGTDGSGIYGISSAPRTGAQGYAGVSGYNQSNLTDRFGVIGSSLGTTSGSIYSAGVGGYGDYGVLGFSGSNTGAGIIAQHAAGKTALEINNGFIKATGAADNKTAFTITATAANSTAHILRLSYVNQAQTDILIVTHSFNPPGAASMYLNAPYSVYWNGTTWTIYLDNLTSILNQSFNVLVIKQ